MWIFREKFNRVEIGLHVHRSNGRVESNSKAENSRSWDIGAVAFTSNLMSRALLMTGLLILTKVWADSPYVELAPEFDRRKSSAMVRKIASPTPANLDCAAYFKNPLRYDPEPQKPKKVPEKVDVKKIQFEGLLLQAVNSLKETNLSDEEKNSPMAWTPLQNHLWEQTKDPAFAELTGKINGYKWADPEVYKAYQEITAAYLHQGKAGKELWVQIDFSPWVSFLKNVTDEDGDGYREIFGRLNLDSVKKQTWDTSVEWMRSEYLSKVLSAEEVQDWAQTLASYWYPSLNTDIVEPGKTWPDAGVEKEIRKKLGDFSVKNPTVVIRGNPFEKPIYNVFVVEGVSKGGGDVKKVKAAGESASKDATTPEPGAARVPKGSDGSSKKSGNRPETSGGGSKGISDGKDSGGGSKNGDPKGAGGTKASGDGSKGTSDGKDSGGSFNEGGGGSRNLSGESQPAQPSQNFTTTNAFLDKQSKAHGGYQQWHQSLKPFRSDVSGTLKALPSRQLAVPGKEPWLFFRRSCEYLLAGDLTSQKSERNPLPHIVQLQEFLNSKGVSMIFVPVPSKAEVYFDRLSDVVPPSEWVHPYGRKFLRDLQSAGVEVMDLLPRFLEAKKEDPTHGEKLYQLQDTHWTTRGLVIAAEVIAERIAAYPWYASLTKETYSRRDTVTSRKGDIVDKLPEKQRKNYPAVELKAIQVMDSQGKPYKTDRKAPVILMGDSYTGVFELIDCKSAGVGAHISAGTGLPLDIITSWGGGPLVRQKLIRARKKQMQDKKLVIYMMTARDLYNYSQSWEPLKIGGK